MSEEKKMMRNAGAEKRNEDDPGPPPNRTEKEKGEDLRPWGILLFGLIGATATTFAVGQLRRTVDWFYVQIYSMPCILYNSNVVLEICLRALTGIIANVIYQLTSRQSSWKGATGGSFRTSFQEEAWKRYNRRMQEEYEEEMERVERIRRMQSVFNRERNKYKRSYESWRENDSGKYHQHFQRDDWYWKTDTSYKDQKTNFKEKFQDTANYPLSHHYSVLGLNRLRTKPYTDDEIKRAFRAKAKEFHPDQNQNNKEASEAKFKQVMTSYEAIKCERKNNKS